MCSKFIDFEIQNLEFLNDLECSHNYQQSYSGQSDLYVLC